MNCKSLFFFEVKDTPYNGEDFHVFLEQLFTYFDSNQIESAYVVMDNVNFHKTERVRELFSSKSHQVFLPPYSPMLNPIENLFSQWKNSIKRTECHNENELYAAISDSSAYISEQDCANYFRNMEKYIEPCILRQQINN